MFLLLSVFFFVVIEGELLGVLVGGMFSFFFCLFRLMLEMLCIGIRLLFPMKRLGLGLGGFTFLLGFCGCRGLG
jgi:hypothetical protein